MPQGYAFHFGLNTVDAESLPGLKKLRNAENDAQAYHQLCEQAGLKSRLYLGEEATSENYISEIISLANQVKPGDLLFVSFCGHGSRVKDISRDEDDGYDEVLFFYDRMVMDDEINLQFHRFKEGVRIIFVTDSCHSGTVAKELAPRDAESDEEVLNRDVDMNKTEEIFRSTPLYGAIKRSINEKAVPINASLLHFAACQDHQKAWDGNVAMKNGGFTSVFLAVWNGGKFQGNYESLYQAIKGEMSSEQVPNFSQYGKAAGAFSQEKPFQL